MMRLNKGTFLAILLCIVLGVWVVYGESNIPSEERELELERKLKLLNKPAIKSIQSEDGDIIDCVDINKQPAFDNPLLKKHTIQMKPKQDPLDAKEMAPSPSPASGYSLSVSSQVWRKNGSCPLGTIPIRRVQKHHLLNAPLIDNYGKKVSHSIEKHELGTPNHTFSFGMEALHSLAVLVTGGYSYSGAKASINVWNPPVEANDEYSSGLLRLKNGPFDDSDSIEVGWIVNPAVYGDRRTRFYIYWTDDSGKKTGCFDLLCSGFVQTTHEIALGTAIEPISVRFGQQYHVTFYVYKDDSEENGHWWLVIGDNTTIGYWPNTLFKHMFHMATLVEWGGDVYSPRMRLKPHTATAMGSGRWAYDHWGSAACVQTPRIRDYASNLKYPDPSFAFSLEPDCYNSDNYAQALFTEPLLYFGGPGRTAFCP